MVSFQRGGCLRGNPKIMASLGMNISLHFCRHWTSRLSMGRERQYTSATDVKLSIHTDIHIRSF
jgi:hypothetical protein